jgi:hypothetical protein
MNLAGCGQLATHPENQVWYRAIQPQFWSTALATAHSSRIPSRFSPATNVNPAFPVLYLAEDHQVALFEVGALLGSALPGAVYVPNPLQAWVLLNVHVTLQSVAHLTDVAAQQQLATTAQELTGDWQGYHLRSFQTSISQPTGQAPTQSLGAALHAVSGLDGFRAISARVPTRRVLVVFPDKLGPGAVLAFTIRRLGNGMSFVESVAAVFEAEDTKPGRSRVTAGQPGHFTDLGFLTGMAE